jgi:peptide/nickel transport system substrate-binding protein
VLNVPTPARAFNADVISEVSATDESTVQITTPKPDPLVPLRLANPNAGILAPKAYQGDQIDIMGTCTGPFTVTDEAPQQSLTLEANDNYWGGEVTLDSAEVRFIIDGATRATQLQAGEAQIAKSLPVANLSTLEGDTNLAISELELTRTTVMLLNNSRPPFDDPLVRQAIQHAVDPQAIVDAVYEGSGSPAVGPFGPDTPWAPEGAEPAAVDLDEARALLDQAGVDPESLSIELMAYNDRPEFADVAAVIQDQLRQLGIDVKIRAGDYPALEPDMLSGNFDATLLSRGYLVDVADPGGYLTSDWTCDGGYNIAHYCNPETDQMIKDAVAIEDGAARSEAYADIAEKLQSEAASVFLLHEHTVWGTQADVADFQPHPLDYYVLTADLALGGN